VLITSHFTRHVVNILKMYHRGDILLASTFYIKNKLVLILYYFSSFCETLAGLGYILGREIPYFFLMSAGKLSMEFVFSSLDFSGIEFRTVPSIVRLGIVRKHPILYKNCEPRRSYHSSPLACNTFVTAVQ